jgi:HK97 gp10 family phage protein
MRTTKADQKVLMRRVAALRETIRGVVDAAVAECAQAIAGQARENCPVESGRLRDSIGVEVPGDSSGAVIAARVVADTPYAAAVELGLGGQSPQPFVLPAVEAVGRKIEDAIKDSVDM